MTEASRRLIGRGSIYTLASAGPLLAGVLVTPLLTRTVDVAEYGWISICIVVMQWSISLLALGLPVAITRHALSEASGSAGARGIAIVASIGVLLVTVSVALLIGLVEWFLGDNVPVALGLALVAGGAGAGIAMAQAWALAEERSWFYVVLAIAATLVAPGVGMAFVTVLDLRGATAYFAGVAFVNVTLVVIAMSRVASSGPVSRERAAVQRALRIGLPIVPHQFATGSLNGMAVFVAGAVLGHAAGGQVQVAVYLGTVSLVLTSAVGYAWLPVLAGAGLHQRSQLLTDTATTVTWLAGMGSAGVALLSPWLLRVLVPSSYDVDSMVSVTAVACMSGAAAAVYLAHQQVIVLSGRTSALIVISPLAMGIGTLLSWTATRMWGLAGVAAGLPVVYVLLWVFTGVLARRVDVLRWSEKRAVPPVICATAACLIGALLPVGGESATLVRLTLAVVVAAVGLGRLRLVFRKTGRAKSLDLSGMPS